jgi:dolichol-phosphate mannosyltransferase
LPEARSDLHPIIDRALIVNFITIITIITFREHVVMHNVSHSPVLVSVGRNRITRERPLIAVVVPCYKVRNHILEVVRQLGDEVDVIYVVDDNCPDHSGKTLREAIDDQRVRVLFHEVNQGVGGATLTGMRQAIADGAEVIIKLDGDGQMDARLIPTFIETIRSGEADCAKGNRFYDPQGLQAMPTIRLIGNACLSFLAKLSTGYWHVFDPNNGFVAVHAEVARRLPLDKLHKRYFFETDLLFRLNTLKAKVVDVPMEANYGDEQSSLRIMQVIPTFLFGHLRNGVKRIGYNYFLRDFSVASLELVIGLALLMFGTLFGLAHWINSQTPATAGTVMLAGLPVILGIQLLLAFLSHDIQSVPTTALHPRLPKEPLAAGGSDRRRG